MQNVFFLKEAITSAEKNVSFIELNQKQLKEAIIFTANNITTTKNLILVLFNTPAEEILAQIAPLNKNKLIIIDAQQKEGPINNPNIIKISNPGDLTGIQIAIEKAEEQFKGEKAIVFDSINMLSVYNKKETIGKFFHLFNNKIRLEEETAIIFTVKESTDPEILRMLNEFADKSYNYSELFLSGISLMEQIEKI